MKSKLLPYKDEIIKMYVNDKLTCNQIGQKFNIRPTPVARFLTKNNIKLRNRGQQKGSPGTTKGKKYTERSLQYNIQLVESGNYKKLHEASIRSIIRKYLIHKKGHKCEICNLTEWRGCIIPLVCDHIDGDYTNCELTNFRLICNNCDSILPTYKGKNRGKGRKLNRSDG